MAACIIGYLVPALALHDEALEFSRYSMVQEQGTSRSNSLSSISIFLLVQFPRQNDASTPFFYLPSLQTCYLPAVWTQNSRRAVPTQQVQPTGNSIRITVTCRCRPESDRSFTTVSANLGGQVFHERRPSLHAILAHRIHRRLTSHRAAAIHPRHRPSWERESLEKKLGEGKTLWATASSFGQKLHSLPTQGTQQFALDTSRSAAPVLLIQAVRCRPRRSRCAARVPASRSCVHSFDPYLR